MKKKKSLEEYLKSVKITRSPDYTDTPGPSLFPKKVKDAEEFLAKYPPEVNR